MMPYLALGAMALFAIYQSPVEDRTALRKPRPCRPAERGPGLFVSQYVITALACLLLGVAVGVLVWLIPTMWPPVDAALAVIGLALALHGLWRGRRHL
ncbi:hypothetical protein ABZ815_52630 [Nonomuraea sp. NPDC047529]|uniref:hypothetical protein n=1 Tax=Nonomuraea sp. NPDC047529 TaxID=3155623 RepID=UPI0033E5A77A